MTFDFITVQQRPTQQPNHEGLIRLYYLACWHQCYLSAQNGLETPNESPLADFE